MKYDFDFRSRRSNVMAVNGMVASSQPLATMAGLDILRAGGTAADAAVTVAAMLNVVEPFSTGVGGDCFVLFWDATEKTVFALNGSGPAAGSADIATLTQSGYEQFPHFTGHAVSVPGTVGAWTALLERFGKLSLGEVLAPAIKYAFEGYPVTEWIGSGWNIMKKHLLRENWDESDPKHLQYPGPPQPSAQEFLVNGCAPKVGERISLPTLGETLQELAAGGRDFFYTGDFAQKLCNHVQRYDGWLEPSDLARFEAEWVEPIFTDYRGVRLYECPPNGQGLAAIIAAKIAEGYDLANMTPVQRTHTLIECMRLGFLEALQWVSDPHFQDIPYSELFSDQFILSRRELVDPLSAIEHLKIKVSPVGDDTVYLSVVDGAGNACSLINSLYMGGGTGLVVPGTGVLLQNRATTFSLNPDHPNALEPGKRPYHTIIPGMITKDAELFASFGVMGGFMQPQGHLLVLSNMVDLGHNPQQALDMPRFCLKILNGGGVGANDPGGEVYLEAGFSFDEMAALRRKGHHVSPISGRQRIVFGGGQIIQRDPHTGVLVAGSDPRKDGCALGW
ncbi:MAG: gamma-glutamyltransferase family protein [Brevefilum sp.]|nr:gamma-glutamyltransferase family protein [Brevefilum sp.]